MIFRKSRGSEPKYLRDGSSSPSGSLFSDLGILLGITIII